MPPAEPPSFDFDSWTALARRDPQGFFRARERAIADFIEAHPRSRDSLLELQSRVDELRAVAGTPHAALRGILALTRDHLRTLARRVRRLSEEAAARE